MGTKRDVEVANLLARQAEIKARREASPALSPEWRWSRTGWGGWSAERAPGLEALEGELSPATENDQND